MNGQAFPIMPSAKKSWSEETEMFLESDNGTHRVKVR